MPTNFEINSADLAYILRQIKIGEASSIGYTPDVAPVTILQAIMNEYGASAVNAAQLPAGLRTVDGTYNNLVGAPTGLLADVTFNPATSEFGAADTLFPRLTDPVYRNEGDDSMSFGPGAPTLTNNNYAGSGNVVDADPRLISNLIVDMSVTNPAAIQTFINNPVSAGMFEDEMGYAPTEAWFTNPANAAAGNEWLQQIKNLSPDIGLSPGFNSWMTFFGQFFDHGLDLVTKGSAGTVYIPLQPDDPLIAGADGILADDPNTAVNEAADNLPAHLRFMALTRATQTLDANGIPQHENTTTSWIDQNQTYTSHSSHQVFLREYVKDSAGQAVSTGRLLDGTTASGSVNGAIGNWAEVKAQALTMLGIRLGDFDVHNVPLLLTDQYGKFIPGVNGYAQLVMAPDATHTTNWLKEGTAAGITTAGAIGTGHAFLNDIAHHAAPAIVDHDHNPATPRITQTADLDIQDVDRDGLITQVDITANNKDVNRDGVVNAADLVADDGVESTYDDEMLNAHFITGDGRGNENIALSTVHSIFHSEHNRIVEANKATLLADAAAMLAAGKTQAEAVAFLNEWLLVDRATVPVGDVAINGLTWDGERLFQAARFGTEMQYQHLVFEEFARRIQPMVDPFVFNNSPNIDASIVAEFAHTVYRFGHSMLTGTVDRLDNNLNLLNGDADQKTLLAVFLNPQAYVDSGADLEEINANIIRGLSRDVGNSMDEFIVTDVRSNLLGLPLDLGALNIARGRDTGIPSLNETRRQLYDDTGLADLKPYESWVDFAANLKNASSVVNFIAAYGTHSTITSATTMAAKRAAATAIVLGGTGAPSDRKDFIDGTGIYAADKGGLELIDLWIGGLAEASPEFGGMLGTTFNYVFEAQMENLQNGDRMYYLTRTQGQNFLNQLEPNTFADLVMRNTDLGDKYATHLNGALFTTPDLFLELDRGIAQIDYDPDSSSLDPHWADGEPHSPFDQKVTRDYTGSAKVDGNHDVGGTMRYIGGQHVVMGGTEGNDRLYGDRGIDTLWGDGGNDYLNGGTESDDVFGGTGDDIIEDPFGDDLLRGNEGNDVISSARGADILFGNQGSDAIFVGQDASEVFAGSGNDFVLGGSGGDTIFGNEGDDWLEGGAGFDTLIGDNSELFFNSLIIGHDVMFAHADEVDYDAESGDDIMGSGPSVFRYEGMFGFDWGIGKGDTGGVEFNLLQGIFTNVADDILRDRFDKVEALSGYHFDDVLEGDHRGHLHVGDIVGLTIDPTFVEDLLTQEGIDRIHGFNSWFGNVRQTLFSGANAVAGGSEVATTFRDGNVLLGGDGNDLIRGRGGFDLIDGDAYLNVRILITLGSGANIQYYSAESLNTDTTVAGPYAGRVYRMVGNNPQGDVDFAAGPAFGGRSVSSLLLDRTINPAQMSIVREIKYDATNLTGALQNYDTAVFNGTLAEYDIEGRTVDAFGVQLSAARDVNNDGFISVHDRDDGITGATVTINGVTTTLDSRGVLFVDDTDFLKNIEELRFADQTLVLSGPRMPVPPAVDLHAYELVTSSVQYRDQFTNPVFNNSQGTTAWNTSWVETGDGTNTVGGGQIQTDNNDNNQLRFLGGTTAANDGASITRTVNLAGQTAATLSYNYGYAGIDPGETLTVEFSADGVTFEQVHQVSSGGLTDDSSGGGTPLSFSVGLTGPFTANAAVRFTTSALNLGGENFRVDNVTLAATTSTQVAVNDGSGFTATFTEDGAGVAIARNAGITDPDSANMLMAQVRLTNAQASDLLSIAGTLPAGISSSINTAVAGVITLTLSGSASRAAYQTAIEAVRFSNSSQNPNTTPRNIEVTVNDGRSSSPVAVATVNVVAVNDAPTAVADAVFTNVVAGSPIIIPEWVLLANDSDPEGSVLDVSALSAALGVTGLSLTANPGSVTVVDDATAGGSFIYTASDGALTSSAAVTLTRQGTAQVADDFNGVGAVRSAANNSTGTVAWTTSWSEVNDDANIRTGQIQIDGAGGNGTNQLRFINGDGASIQRGVDLSGASAATLSFAFDKNGIDVGETLQVQFAADGVNFVTLDTITNTNGTNNSGNAAGTLSLALPGTLSAASAIRFVASGISTAGEDIRIDNLRIDYAVANAVVTGTANGEILLGNETGSLFNALGGADRIIAGGGDDTINAGAGDDTIIWSVGDGRDFVDGGANGVVGDRFVVNGDDSVEDYKVYARAEAIAAGIAVLNAATEIVVVRNNVVIAELDGIEEITINTAGGADTTAAIGNFGPTDLFFNTVTVNGGNGADMIDASQLTSAHRLVLNPGTAQPAAATAAGAAAPAAPAAADPFTGIGQSTIDALARGGLLDPVADGFVGSSHNGAFSAAFLAAIEQGFGLRSNMVFDREPARDFAPSDFDHATKFHNLQALHFDAADHLIS